MRLPLAAPLCLALTAACLSVACSSAPPAASPAGVSGEQAEELTDFDPAEEQAQQPFEAVNGLRGPSLNINGLRLRGERGQVRLMVSAYDEGRDIVFQFLPRAEIPADWLARCPRSTVDPAEPQIEVLLAGVGDLSHNVLQQPDFGWSTSLDIARYAALDTLRFRICGDEYALEDTYGQRLVQHVRTSTHRAATAYRQERYDLERSCGQGKGKDCLQLAEMMMYGQGGGQEVASARSLYLEQCEKGAAAGCLGASTATMVDGRHSQDKVASYREAMALAVRACELGGNMSGPGCWRAAMLQAAGLAMPADAAGAQRSLDVGCKLRFEQACTQREALLSCARGKPEACLQLADAEAVRVNSREVGEETIWRLAACKRGHAASCPR